MVRDMETLWGLNFIYEVLPGQFPVKIAVQNEFSKRSIASKRDPVFDLCTTSY